MKQLLTTLAFLLTIQSGWSQMEMKLKPRISIQGADSLFARKPPSFMSNSHLLNTDSSQFSHSTEIGSVYISTQDGMRWLKPDPTVVYTMPVQTNTLNDNMPKVYQPGFNKLLPLLRRKNLN